MENQNLAKLTVAKCTLLLLANGLRPKGVTVKEVADAVGAPKGTWRTRKLLKWVDEKILVTSMT